MAEKEQPIAWVIDTSLVEAGKMKRYRKRHPSEVASCFVNLGLVLDRLNFGIPFQNVEYGFLRSEGEGIYRIGQPGIPHAKETRLYIYVHIVGSKIYTLTIGDKDTQQDDINRCKATVRAAFGRED